MSSRHRHARRDRWPLAYAAAPSSRRAAGTPRRGAAGSGSGAWTRRALQECRARRSCPANTVADARKLGQCTHVQLGILGQFVVSGALASGCFYLEPMNRPPSLSSIKRLCDDAHPAAPCTLENLHDGDQVLAQPVFNDPDGDEDNGAVHWRVSACADQSDASCSAERLYDDSIPVVEFEVRPTLNPDGTGGPTHRIDFELRVFDERGALTFGEYTYDVIRDGAPAALPSMSPTP